MLQGYLAAFHRPAVIVTIAGSVIGNKHAGVGTHSLCGDIRHRGKGALHILGIIALGRRGTEVEGARAGAVDHLAIPAHLPAIAVRGVLDENAIRQNVAVAVRIHLHRTREVPDAVLRPGIEVHSLVADTVRTLSVGAVVVAIAGVRICRKAVGHRCTGIAGHTLDAVGGQALLALPVVEESGAAGPAHRLAVDALDPRVAGPRIVHLGSVDHQRADNCRIEGGRAQRN